MITDEIIRDTFISNVMSKGIKEIYAEQANVVSTNLNRISGSLLNNLTSAPFDIEGTTAYIRILPYLRFLDINSRQNMGLRRSLALYNRTVWGHLYGYVLPTLRFGLTQDVKKYISQQLQDGSDIDKDILNSLVDY